MSIYLILIIAIVLIIVVSAFVKGRANKGMLQALKRQAVKRGGDVKGGTLLYYPRLSLEFDGVSFIISAMPGGGTRGRRGDMTYVDFSVPSLQDQFFRIMRKSESVQSAIDSLLSVKEIKIGNEEFVRMFKVKGNDEYFISEILFPEIQNDLMKCTNKQLDIKFEKGRFLLSIDGIATSDQDYDKVIETSVLFLNRLKKYKGRLSGRR
ncbi:MAG: DUF3137 domain-containing protein [Nitrospirae bacterium]|nr:DUF3137 domain-containing protein [Nitrospirota bacterium]